MEVSKAIYASSSDGLSIESIYANTGTGVSRAIELLSSNNVSIQNVDISDFDYGLYTSLSNSLSVQNGSISDVDTGAQCTNSSSLHLDNLEIYDFTNYGIALTNLLGATVIENITISHTLSATATGLRLQNLDGTAAVPAIVQNISISDMPGGSVYGLWYNSSDYLNMSNIAIQGSINIPLQDGGANSNINMVNFSYPL